MSALLHRPLLLTGTWCWWALRRLEVLSWHLQLLWCGILHRSSVGISSIAVLYVYRDSLLHHSLHHRPAGESAPPPPPSPVLVSVRLLLTHCFPYSSLTLCCAAFLCFFKNTVLDLPLPWVDVLESSGTVCFGTEQPKLLLTKATPADPHCQDPTTCTQ